MTRIPLMGAALLAGLSVPCPAQTQRAAAAPAAPVALDRAERRQIVASAIARIRDYYVFPARVPAIARALRAALSGGAVGAAASPAAFAEALNVVLVKAANDRHLRLSYSPEPLPTVGPGDGPDPAELAQMQAMMVRRNFAMTRAELLDGNVGYLRLDLFARAEPAGPTFAAAMAFLQHSDALIIDLRQNGGGDPAMVALAVSYLVPGQTLINSFHRRGQAVDEQSWSLPLVPGGRWSVSKPVYVLAGKRTASGAEEFAYDLQQLKRATIVGEPTWGGANPGDFLPIDSHFAIFVPVGAAVNPISHTNWEGVGVRPDVAAEPGTALATAHRLALAKLLQTATGTQADELRAALAGLPR